MTAALLGLGAHRPARRVGNDELAARLDTDDAWIRRRTGIRTRRIAGPDESVVAMAADAARKALADSGRDGCEVDLVVLVTCTAPTPLPGGAAAVAAALGARSAGAFDLNAACAGFCYGLSVAADAVRGGSARLVVVAASERMSDVVDWQDRSSAVLFGDGAGAVIVGAGPGTRSGGADGIGPVVWGSDGARAALIAQPPGGKLGLDGPAVFRWAVTDMAAVARRACGRAGVTPAELGAFVPHQANARIVLSVARELGVPEQRVALDVADSANTSSASIPLALTRMRELGSVNSADLALLLGFGAGLTWAGQVVAVP